MKNRWKDSDAQAAIKKYKSHGKDIALRVYTSRLIGSEPNLVLHGGGNTSVKTFAKNRVGEEIPTLFVKGSGWDLDTLEPPGLPGVKLEPLLQLRPLKALSDEDMVNEQRINLLDSKSPNPSVETLLHAYLPHKFVDHSHADAILAIANQPNSKKLCREIFGDTLGIVDYIMPGFALAKAAAEAYEKHPSVQGLVLINHGLFTFADSAKESYDYHIQAVSKAERFLAKQKKRKLTPVQVKSKAKGNDLLQALGPVLRGLYQKHSGASWTVHHRPNDKAKTFATSKEVAQWSQIGTVTPDHVIRTKQKPLLLNPKNINDPEALWNEVSAELDKYCAAYHNYFKTNVTQKKVNKKELDRLPRVILVAGLGLLTIGKTTKETKISVDIYEHTLETIHNAFNVGKFKPLDDADLFDMEYWSLEQAKLGKSVAPKLQGKVVYVTGAASGIGLATARLFAKHGANVFMTDINKKALESAMETVRGEAKVGVAGEALDISNETAVSRSFQKTVELFGGLDMVLSNAGNAPQGRIGDVDSKALRQSFDINFFSHQTVASNAVNIFLRQKTGGVLLFNASKAAFNPGKNFGPYALPKSAVVALCKQYALDYGDEGIRANAINADRIRTGLFTEAVIKKRAAARGLKPDDYFKNNLLGQEVYDWEVAEGFLHLALAEKTTGSVLTVDGGNIAASPR